MQQQGFNDQVLQGSLAFFDVFLPGPGRYLVGDNNVLTLVVSHGEVLDPSVSVAVALVNDVPVHSWFLTPDTARQREIHIPLPAARLKPNTNHIQIRYVMRLPGEGCTDLLHPGLTATVYKQTRIRYQYLTGLPRSSGDEPDLGRFPVTFLDPSNGVSNSVVLGVADNPTDTDLRAAMTLAAGMERSAEGRPIQFRMVPWSRLPVASADANTVLIGKPNDSPVWDAVSRIRNAPVPLVDRTRGVFRYGDENLGRDDGVLQDVASPWNPNGRLLVVSGATDEAVMRSALGVTSDTGRRLLNGAGGVVTQRTASAVAATGGPFSNIMTFARLGYGDRVIRGWGFNAATFVFSTGGVTPPGAKVTLIYSHTKLINFSRSSMVVNLNGVPLLDTGLKPDISDRQRLEVQLPARALRPGRNVLTVQFGLTPIPSSATGGCPTISSEIEWAVVYGDSSIEIPANDGSIALPVGTGGSPSLAAHPFPFVRDGNLADFLLVLPDDLALAEQAPALAAGLGRGLTADVVEFPVTTAGRLTTEARASKHLILFGQPQENKAIADLLTSLPVRLDAGGRVLRGATDPLAGVRDATHVGVIQIITSPFNSTRAILVVTGNSPQSLALAIEGLTSATLQGNAALVTPPLPNERDPQVRTVDIALTLPGGVTAPLLRARDAVPGAVSAAVGALVVAILGLTGATAVRIARARRTAPAGGPEAADWDDWIDMADVADSTEKR